MTAADKDNCPEYIEQKKLGNPLMLSDVMEIGQALMRTHGDMPIITNLPERLDSALASDCFATEELVILPDGTKRRIRGLFIGIY